MFDAIKSLVADLSGRAISPQDLDGHAIRLASAALLVHAALTDGRFSDVERGRLKALLAQRFDLDDRDAETLLSEASEADSKAVDLYRFTSVLMNELDYAGRCRIVEMLWQVAYADHEASPFEENLIWRVADLLGVDSRERIALRQRVAAARLGGDA